MLICRQYYEINKAWESSYLRTNVDWESDITWFLRKCWNLHLSFEISHLVLTANLLDVTDDRIPTIETQAIFSGTSGVISIHAALGDNNRFQEEHMRVCEMLHHFIMLWEHDLAINVHVDFDKWTQLIQTDQIMEWRLLLNESRQPEFPNALRAIISAAWTPAQWSRLWTNTRTEWDHLIEFYDEMINDEIEKTDEED